jgi:hypothetical protein
VNRFCALVQYPGLRDSLLRRGASQHTANPAQPSSRQAPQQKPQASPAPKQQAQAGVLEFSDPFENDPESGIFLPHEAEYSLTASSSSYDFMMNGLDLVPTGKSALQCYW